MQRGQPREWRLCAAAFSFFGGHGLVIGGRQRGESSTGGKGGGGVSALPSCTVEEVLKCGHAGRHGFFEARTGTGGVDAEGGKSLPKCMGGGCFGTGTAGVIGAKASNKLVRDVLKSNHLHGQSS